MNNLINNQNYRNYKDWMPIKEEVQSNGVLRKFKEWEIWWCAIGENVGIEINGEGERFSRPVIIYHKFSRFGFMGIPLTTKSHVDKAPDWYTEFTFKGKIQFAALNQLERINVYRLYRKIGEMNDNDILKIIKGFNILYIKNTSSS